MSNCCTLNTIAGVEPLERTRNFDAGIARTPPDEGAAWLDPIDVCSLSPSELADRIAWIRRELLSSVVARIPLDDGVALELDGADRTALRAGVMQWVDMERSCCGGIEWMVAEGMPSEHVRVEIRGVDPSGSLFADLPAHREKDVPARSRGWLRSTLAAGGIGAALSLFVCCVLPMVLSAVVGTTAIVAPLVYLDDPLWIVLVWIIAGVIAYRWRSRRRVSEY